MAKKAPEGPMTTVVVRLPPNTLAALKAAAVLGGRGERGMSEEIRRRLEASLLADETAPQTRYLSALLTHVAENLSDYFGQWWKDRFAFWVLRSAVATLLERLEPPGIPTPKPNPNSLADLLFDPKGGHEPIGRTLAAIALETVPNPKVGGKG